MIGGVEEVELGEINNGNGEGIERHANLARRLVVDVDVVLVDMTIRALFAVLAAGCIRCSPAYKTGARLFGGPVFQ